MVKSEIGQIQRAIIINVVTRHLEEVANGVSLLRIQHLFRHMWCLETTKKQRSPILGLEIPLLARAQLGFHRNPLNTQSTSAMMWP